jgi:hypothetical protein
MKSEVGESELGQLCEPSVLDRRDSARTYHNGDEREDESGNDKSHQERPPWELRLGLYRGARRGAESAAIAELSSELAPSSLLDLWTHKVNGSHAEGEGYRHDDTVPPVMR